MTKKVILLFFLTVAIIIIFSLSIVGSPKPEGNEVSQQKQEGERPLARNLQPKSQSPEISVSFMAKSGCEAHRVLQVKVTGVQKESILAISLIPEIDGIDADANLAKPIPPAGYRELHGLPVVRTVKSPGGTWDICFPSFVFDRNTYLPPDSRHITGWIVRAYLLYSIVARPLAGGRTIGKLQILTIGDLQDGLYLLGTQMEKEKFSFANFEVIAIPQSNAGVFFYVDEKALVTWTKQEFDIDMFERKTQ